jgi:hypothetical protein
MLLCLVILLSEYHLAHWHSAETHFDEWHSAESHFAVILLNIMPLSVILFKIINCCCHFTGIHSAEYNSAVSLC